jgi:hypothetical protein
MRWAARVAPLYVTLAMCACERKAPAPANTRAATRAKPASVAVPTRPQQIALWIPQWELALEHPDSIPVTVGNVLDRCEKNARVRLNRDTTETAALDGVLLVSVTNEPPDNIAAAKGGLGGHAGQFTTLDHPSGCRVVLTYFAHFNQPDDTAAVRRIIESVRMGPDAPTKGHLEPDSLPTPLNSDSARAGADSSMLFDMGIGLVTFDDRLRADTLIVHSAPDVASPVAARIVRDSAQQLHLLSPGSAEARSVEYAYEVSGLAVFDIGADSAWLHVAYGRDTTGSATHTGWVRRVPERVFYRSWTDLILARHAPVYPRYPSRASYHASPNGPSVPETIVAEGHSAAMTPERAQGDWMLVRARTPDDGCDTRVARARESFVWVRYLDARGRPLLLYAPRGC